MTSDWGTPPTEVSDADASEGKALRWLSSVTNGNVTTATDGSNEADLEWQELLTSSVEQKYQIILQVH